MVRDGRVTSPRRSSGAAVLQRHRVQRIGCGCCRPPAGGSRGRIRAPNVRARSRRVVEPYDLTTGLRTPRVSGSSVIHTLPWRVSPSSGSRCRRRSRLNVMPLAGTGGAVVVVGGAGRLVGVATVGRWPARSDPGPWCGGARGPGDGGRRGLARRGRRRARARRGRRGGGRRRFGHGRGAPAGDRAAADALLLGLAAASATSSSRSRAAWAW